MKHTNNLGARTFDKRKTRQSQRVKGPLEFFCSRREEIQLTLLPSRTLPSFPPETGIWDEQVDNTPFTYAYACTSHMRLGWKNREVLGEVGQPVFTCCFAWHGVASWKVSLGITEKKMGKKKSLFCSLCLLYTDRKKFLWHLTFFFSFELGVFKSWNIKSKYGKIILK